MKKTLLSLLTYALFPAAVLAQQPVLKFSFNSNLTSDDNEATLTCSAPAYGPARTGTTGASYFFNGNASSVATGNIPSYLTGLASRSVTFWANFNAQFGPGNIDMFGLGNGSINNAGFSLGILGGSNPSFYADNGQFVYANAPITNFAGNVWNHFAVTNGTNGFVVYQNGVQISAVPQAIINLIGANFSVGMSNDFSTGNTFYMDDLAFYDTQLTPLQVQQIANDAATPTISVNVNPIADIYATAVCIVDANSSATTLTVEYGTTPAFGSVIQVPNQVTGTNTQLISVPLSNLLPETTYYVRASAVNGLGSVTSNTFTFTTSSFIVDVPIIQNTNVIATSPTSFTVDFEVNPRGSQTLVELLYTPCPNTPAMPVNIGNATLTIPAGQGFVSGSLTVTGLSPNTDFAYSIRATNSVSNVQTSYACTATVPSVAVTSNVLSNVTTNSAQLDFSVLGANIDVNYNVLIYLDQGSFDADTAVFVANYSQMVLDLTGQQIFQNLISGTPYTYRIRVESNLGDIINVDGSFTTLTNANAPTPIHEFKFDNSHLDTVGDYGFQTSSGNASSFANDRFGNAASALKIIPGSSVTATPPANRPLPQGNSERTISFWANYTTIFLENNIFGYGSTVAGQGLGIQENSTLVNVYLWGSSLNNIFYPGTIITNKWYHYVITYGNGQLKFYRDNILYFTGSANLNTQGSMMRLGRLLNEGPTASNTADALIDDLKIYDVTLTAAQVAELFNNNALSVNEVIKTKNTVAVYPNPTNGIVKIDSELPIEKVLVFQMNGQLVLESKQSKFDLSALPSNVYVLKIVDKSGEISTHKLIKN